MDLMAIGERVALIFVPFLFAICFHEWAHAWVARKLGDHTAELMGRLTLNPVSHMDPIGTVVFPMLAIVSGGGFFFGWARPVPVSTRNLKHPRKDMFWIALAGPMSNVFLAFVSAFIFSLNAVYNPYVTNAGAINQILEFFIVINLSLAFFNLIPIHPLDGGKIMARFLPETWNIWLEDNSQVISYAFFFLIIFDGLFGKGASFITYPIIFTANLFIGLWGFVFAIL